MSAVLRIALTSFSFVPIQRWLNAVAILLLAGGALWYVAADDPNADTGGFAFILMGVVLLCLTPTFAGGVAMRFGSTRSLLHMRPHGRLRMVLGATLAISVLAGLVALPWLSAEWYAAVHDRAPPSRHIPAAEVLQVSWAVIALAWIVIFAISRSMVTMALMGILPVLVFGGSRVLGPRIPDTGWVLAAGLVCWCLFAAWYLRTPSVRRPEFSMSGGETSVNAESTPMGRLAALMVPPRPLTREQSMLQYLLGSHSLLYFVLTGAWVALIFSALHLLSAGFSQRGSGSMLAMLSFVSFFNGSLGYATARRVRLLWLRTDLDRAGLFRLAERWGQRGAMTTWLTITAVAAATAMFAQPEQASDVLLFLVLQATLAVALFYAGMAIVSDWRAGDVLLCIGLGLLMFVQMGVFHPRHALAPQSLLWAMLAALVLAVALRAFAARRWRTLDWRVAKMPRMGTRC